MVAKSQFKGTREWMKGDEDLLSFQQRVLAADNAAQTEADMLSGRQRSPEEAVYRTAAVHQDRLGLNEQLVLAASGTISGQVAEGCKAEDQIPSVHNETVSRTVSQAVSKAGRFCETLEASKHACACGSCEHASYIPADMRSNKYVFSGMPWGNIRQLTSELLGQLGGFKSSM